MPDIVSSATSSSLPSIAEEAGAPQELTPEREAEIRDWRDELGAGTSFTSVGPYCALRDALGEIDRLRVRAADLARARQDITADLADALLKTTDGDDVHDDFEIPAGEVRRILAELVEGDAR